MLEILVDIVRLLTLFLILGAVSIMMMGALYLASEEVREMVHDFEMWAAHRRLARRLRKNPEPYPVLTKYAEQDKLVDVLLFEERKGFHCIFDAVVEDHDIIPRRPLRPGKPEEYRDQSILDRATEFNRDTTE